MNVRAERTIRRQGFTLLELLAVLVVVIILTAMLGPMFDTGGKLTGAGNQLTALIDQARLHSMSKNVLTALVLVTDAGTDADYRAFALLDYDATVASPAWQRVSKWEKLPAGVVVDASGASTFIKHSVQPLPFAADVELPVAYAGASLGAHYAARVFVPSGGLSNPDYPAEIELVEGSYKGGRTVYGHTADSQRPANWYRISILGATGRVKIERP